MIYFKHRNKNDSRGPPPTINRYTISTQKKPT